MSVKIYSERGVRDVGVVAVVCKLRKLFVKWLTEGLFFVVI